MYKDAMIHIFDLTCPGVDSHIEGHHFTFSHATSDLDDNAKAIGNFRNEWNGLEKRGVPRLGRKA